MFSDRGASFHTSATAPPVFSSSAEISEKLEALLNATCRGVSLLPPGFPSRAELQGGSPLVFVVINVCV